MEHMKGEFIKTMDFEDEDLAKISKELIEGGKVAACLVVKRLGRETDNEGIIESAVTLYTARCSCNFCNQANAAMLMSALFHMMKENGVDADAIVAEAKVASDNFAPDGSRYN
jgi:hypothetical protein